MTPTYNAEMTMSRFDQIRARSRWSDILEGQPQHLLMLALMLCGAAWLLEDSPGQGRFLGLDSLDWAWASIWLAVLHQAVVAFGFRMQLHRAIFTRLWGKRDFANWQWIFLPLLVARPITLLVTAVLDAGSLSLWRPGTLLLGVLLILPAAWTLNSVLRHFTIRRATGGDHFRARYLSMPMVKQGSFRWFDNSMYALAFLGLWGIALIAGSWQALVVACFQHAYIWVHMYTVEAPDMRWLYGPLDAEDGTD
ncbi:methyltransferase [Aliiruegeria lutimaris]|uniref:Phospholipid methyltransferase n=1 Tax=Aliiruegeria lutimaris TaxID=571298 RepID=A0A1G9E456_9RHOB|nr:methyltransferase [Aliiruegeria lutimaris]SDK70894.1 Phospholipid methyltransferase [Aliiruegeria lutimaris]